MSCSTLAKKKEASRSPSRRLAGDVTISTRNRWPGLVAVTKRQQVVAVSTYGEASVGEEPLLNGQGLKAALVTGRERPAPVRCDSRRPLRDRHARPPAPRGKLGGAHRRVPRWGVDDARTDHAIVPARNSKSTPIGPRASFCCANPTRHLAGPAPSATPCSGRKRLPGIEARKRTPRGTPAGFPCRVIHDLLRSPPGGGISDRSSLISVRGEGGLSSSFSPYRSSHPSLNVFRLCIQCPESRPANCLHA